VSLNLGIVGLPNVGKSTLFNALTRNNVLAANYPFATIEPNEGVVALPDPRLTELATMFDSEKIVPAPVTFVDIAGIVKGASEGAGLGNKFLANIRESDAICQVVRVFTDDDVTHVDGRIDPKSDIEVIETELILADLQTLEKALPRLEKEARTHKERRPAYDAAVAAQELLNGGTTMFAAGIDASILRELNLLTTKPFLYVFNADEAVLTDDARVASLRELVAPADAVFLDAKIEAELQELDDESAAELLESIGQPEPGMNQLIRIGFRTLGVQTFLDALLVRSDHGTVVVAQGAHELFAHVPLGEPACPGRGTDGPVEHVDLAHDLLVGRRKNGLQPGVQSLGALRWRQEVGEIAGAREERQQEGLHCPFEPGLA